MAAAIFALSCCGLQVALAAGGMSVFVIMSNYVAGEQITVMWYNNVAGADHYDCTVLNQSTGYYPRKRSTSSSGYDCYISGSKVEAGNYKVWVGAVDANGDVIDDGYAYFTVNEANDCDHKWDAETGTCKWCDEECRHNNGVYEIETKSTGKSISDTKHEIIDTYNEECKICRYVLNTGLTKRETGRHSFDSNGDCVLCDYRAACKHRETTTEHLSTSYDLHNDTKHAVKVVSNIICANKNCGKLIEYGGSIEVYYEYHDMQDNRCTLCGYAIQYDPVSVNISRGQSSAYVGENIHASCSASGGSGDYTYYWCVYRDGSEIYQTADWNKYGSIIASSEGAYTFYVRVEDRNTGSYASATTSTISVTKAPCQHTNTTTLQDGDTQYIKVSDSKHTVRTNWVEVCGDCGTKLSAWYSDEAQDHNYANGNCVNCGSAEPAPSPTECAHPSMRSVESSRSTRTIASDEQHLVDITWEDYCEACGILLNKTRTTTEYQAHTYDGLVCTLCGYAKQDPNATVPCDHANHNKEEISSEVKPYDDQMHVVLTTYKVSCADCGIMLNETASETNYEAHRYINGICACGQVGHVHNYEKIVVSKPTYTNLNTNEHSVTTTYYTKCSGCGDTTAQVTDSTNEAHSYTDKGHIEAEHHDGEGHKTFDRCVCGAVNYTGYATYKNCCGCHGHVWQDAKIENGKWREYCSICGKYRIVDAPVIEEEHVHDFKTNTTVEPAMSKHPHVRLYKCDCGEIKTLTTINPNCCECVGHSWESSFYNGYAVRQCLACGERHEEKTPESEALQEYIDLLSATRTEVNEYKEKYHLDEYSSALWRLIALQATNKLTDEGFVFGVQYTDALQNAGSTIKNAVVDAVVPQDKYTEQQIELWKTLIVEMLTDHEVAGTTQAKELASTANTVLGTTWNVADGAGVGQAVKNIKHDLKVDQEDIQYLEDMVKDLSAKFESLADNTVGTDPNYAKELELMRQTKDKMGELQQNIDSLKEGVSTDKATVAIAESIPWLLTGISAVAEGGNAVDQMKAMREAYEEMASNEIIYANNVEALNAIISDAKVMNNSTLKAAAENVLEQINTEYAERNLGIWKELKNLGGSTGTFVWNFGGEMVDGTSNILFDKLLDKAGGSYMGVVSIGATVVDVATNHKEVYESAETLMALGTMSSGMDLFAAAKNASGTDYSYKLWAELQAMGCDKAVDFIAQHKDDGWFQVTIGELGIPAKARQEVYTRLNDDKTQYLQFSNQRIGK
ncbi:MAG: hypothetical protein PUC00_04120 [Clostridiales bacterium]|nr:hypothetical protein [Clostridiales bacterium]